MLTQRPCCCYCCSQLPLPHGVPLMLNVLLAKDSYHPLVRPLGHLEHQALVEDGVSVAVSAVSADGGSGGAADTGAVKNGGGSTKSLAGEYLRRTLHVQSISAWAPSCIGPYSQVRVVAGSL